MDDQEFCPHCKGTSYATIHAHGSEYASLLIHGHGSVYLSVCLNCGTVFLNQHDREAIRERKQSKPRRWGKA